MFYYNLWGCDFIVNVVCCPTSVCDAHLTTVMSPHLNKRINLLILLFMLILLLIIEKLKIILYVCSIRN